MKDGQTIAVVVPAYQEERLLSATVENIPDVIDWIVVVDDASTDGTWDIASRLARDSDRVRALRHAQNQGVGAAIVTGYRHAQVLGADIAVVMAGDNQMDPDDLPALIAPILKGADYVKGNRLMHPERRAMPPKRRFGTAVLASITGVIAGIPELGDSQCGYTAIRCALFDPLEIESLFPRYGYPNDILIRLGLLGANVVEVPVRPVYADEVSGLKVRKVIGPISKILFKGALRRMAHR